MPTPPDPVSLIDQLTWQLPLTVSIALVLGAIGGLLPAQGDARSPAGNTAGSSASPKKYVRPLVGAVAAVAILFVADIQTPLQLVCGSLVAGYAGSGVLAALESRVLAAVAVRDAAAARIEAAAIDADARVLATHLDVLATATGPAAVSAAAANAARDVDAIRRRRNWQ